MRNWSRLSLLAAALLFGCSSGGSTPGADIQEKVQSFSLGAVRGDVPTTVRLPVSKPFYSAATVELAESPIGPFEPGAGTLPMPVAAGQDADLWITFTPPVAPAAALQEGTIRLVFRPVSGDGAFPMTLQLHAQVETPSARLMRADISAGTAAVGETVRFGVYFENTSVATPIMVTDVTPPSGEFSLAPDMVTMPFPVGPGSRLFIPMLYQPQGEWEASSLVGVYHSAGEGPLEATVTGEGILPLVIKDYGYVPLDPVTFESEWLTLDVSAEGVGISIEAWGDPSALLDLIGFEGPFGTVYESYDLTGPLSWLSNYPAGARGYLNINLPSSDLPAVKLVSGGGTYRFRLRDSAFATTGIFVRAMVPQRSSGTVREGTLDLRVFLADGLGINPSDPMSNAKLADAMKTIDAILGMADIRLGTITFSFLNPSFNTMDSESQLEELIATNTAGLEEGPLNLFFVNDMTYPTTGIAGVAAAVPGPRANGTPWSGVVIEFERVTGMTVGAEAAHQIVHYLGGPAVDEVLPLANDAYRALRHPLVNPGLPQDLLSPPESTNNGWILATIDMMMPMGTWCGTCTRPALR